MKPKTLHIEPGQTPYYIGIGSTFRATRFWNRRKKAFQDFVCMDCVYPTYRGACGQYQSHKSAAYQAWQRAIEDAFNSAQIEGTSASKPSLWLLSQATMEKHVEGV